MFDKELMDGFLEIDKECTAKDEDGRALLNSYFSDDGHLLDSREQSFFLNVYVRKVFSLLNDNDMKDIDCASDWYVLMMFKGFFTGESIYRCAYRIHLHIN